MANNIQVTQGTGTTVGTDDVAGVHYAKMKLFDGTDNGTAEVATDIGVKANAMRVAPASDITDATYIGDIKFGESLPAGSAAIGKLAANSGVDIGDVDILSIAPGDNNIGNVDIASAIPAGTNLIGKVGIDQTTPGTTNGVQVNAALPAGTNAIGKLAANSGVDIGDVDVTSISAGANLIGDVGIGVRTSGGATIFRSLDIDETEEEIKATAGQVYWIVAINVSTGVRYLKFYNATAANVTVGTTTPVLTLPIPTQSATANGAGFVLAIPNGIPFGTAITVACTTGVADADTGAPGTNDVILNLGFA